MSFRGIAIGLGVIAGLVVLAAGIGGAWLYVKIDQHLTPPPDPPGQPSIATLARPAPEPAGSPPDLLGAFSWSDIATPPKSARAWTRWWWPGGDVDADTAIAQLEVLDEAGFGGVEVQPFLGGVAAVADDEALMRRVYAFDSPAYYDTLRATIAAAAQRGLQVDLTHFSGWPPGGPQVNLEDSLTVIDYGEARLKGGRRVALELPRPKAGISQIIFSMIEFAGIDFINHAADQARLLSVVAARVRAGRHAWHPFNLDDTVTLDPDSITVLTDRVSDGVLHWDAPAGEWTVIASYLMPSGEVPMGAAQKPQGFVIDHLRRPQVLGHYEYAFGERTGLPAYYGRGLRGIFNDSLEFRLKRMAVEDILAEFKARRGYDLEPYLPAIYVEGIDNVYFREILGVHAAPEFRLTDMDARIREDYQHTLSDLAIERFVETSAQWAAQRGLVSRGQSYGMDLDVLRALGANTIPETEQLWAGGADVGLKFASSAAALYGRPMVGAESFVWINRDYMPTARRIKAAADKMLLAGINHIVYHGTPYPWRGAVFGDEGWAPFSAPSSPGQFSANVSPGNVSLWPDVPALNAYIARSQNLLRQGAPQIDVLIHYPFLGFHGPNPEEAVEVLVGGSLPDADPETVAHEDPALTAGKRQFDRLVTVPDRQEDERVAWVRKLQPLLQELDRRGLSWGWVNAHALESGKLANGRLTASGGRYGAILLVDVDRIEASALASLRQRVAEGTPVILSGGHPQRQPGFANAEQGDRAVREGVAALIAAGARTVEHDALVDTLAAATTRTIDYATASTIKRYRRDLGDGGSIHFFGNQSAQADVLTLKVPGDRPLWWFDGVDGSAWPAQAQDGQLELSLGGFESRFLIAGVPIPGTLVQRPPLRAQLAADSRRWPLSGWTISSADFSAHWDALPDWRSIDALRHARQGVYRQRFALDAKADGARYLLDLGLVQGSAAIRVNGRDAGRAGFPPFVVDVTDALVAGDNAIEIKVLAPLRNDFVGRALAGDPRYSQMRRYADALVAAGLMGPVGIVEVPKAQP